MNTAVLAISDQVSENNLSSIVDQYQYLKNLYKKENKNFPIKSLFPPYPKDPSITLITYKEKEAFYKIIFEYFKNYLKETKKELIEKIFESDKLKSESDKLKLNEKVKKLLMGGVSIFFKHMRIAKAYEINMIKSIIKSKVLKTKDLKRKDLERKDLEKFDKQIENLDNTVNTILSNEEEKPWNKEEKDMLLLIENGKIPAVKAIIRGFEGYAECLPAITWRISPKTLDDGLLEKKITSIQNEEIEEIEEKELNEYVNTLIQENESTSPTQQVSKIQETQKIQHASQQQILQTQSQNQKASIIEKTQQSTSSQNSKKNKPEENIKSSKSSLSAQTPKINPKNKQKSRSFL
ncbi:hypothetical protein [Holospora undulata]|nr:hypothetical protein [Holospora undulata]